MCHVIIGLAVLYSRKENTWSVMKIGVEIKELSQQICRQTRYMMSRLQSVVNAGKSISHTLFQRMRLRKDHGLTLTTITNGVKRGLLMQWKNIKDLKGMQISKPSHMARFVDHATYSLDAWYEGRYGEVRKKHVKLDTKILQKFIADMDGWIHMFHGVEDNKVMDEREKVIDKSIFGMTQHGIDKLEPNREIDYGD